MALRMLVSEALGLNRRQPQLDFVDIELSTDTPLFIDPAAFHETPGSFAQACARDIESFFDAVLHAAGTGDTTFGVQLLTALKEPDETQLGLSKGIPRGRGLSSKHARILFHRIQQSRAIETGILRDLSDALMFVRGIGPDIVSDMTTNIIRRHLIEYTQNQFELLGVEIDTELPTGILWDPLLARWTSSFDQIPIVGGRRILLVPKRFVRWRYDFTKAGARYYDEFFVNYIRQDQLRRNGPLVTFVEYSDGSIAPKVYKSDIKNAFPPTKETLETFSAQHPDIYERFKASFFKHNPLSIRALMGFHGEEFQEEAFTRHAITALEKLPTGARHASDYQYLMVGLAHYLFYPELSNPVLERPINTDRKRIDISFDNTADSGFFFRTRTDPFLLAREVVIECKNYSHDISNPEVDQLIGRFDPRRGRLGIILCRAIEDAGRLRERCADAFRSQHGAIIVLTDADVKEMLGASFHDRKRAIESILQSQMRALLS